MTDAPGSTEPAAAEETAPAGELPQHDSVGVEITDGNVAVVTLRRPPVNAMNRELREALIDVLDALQDVDAARCIVLTGAGHVFCAGADIKEKAGLRSSIGDRSRADRLTRDTFMALLGSNKPIIAAINGGALGAGCVLAACCDFIVASETSYFSLPEINVGQGGGTSFLQRIIPPAKVRYMALTGDRVSAAELHRLGSIERCVPAEELLPATLQIAENIAGKSPRAVQAIRGSFGPVEAMPLREAFALEQRYTTELSSSPDAAEARLAFFQKRAPRF